MNEPPAKPTDFVAEKIDSSASQTDVDAYYDVRFTWKDESDNETYFELVLKEYDAAGSEIAHQTFPIKADDDSELARLLGSDDSLIAGSETCTLRLPTGRLFDVTIQSKNAMGGLGEVSRSDSASSNPDYTAYAADVKINLVRRVYNLDGGKLSYKGEAYIGSYYDYNIYDGTDIPLVEIDGTNDTLIKKVGSTEYIFEAWKDDSTHKVLASDFVPAGFKDGAYTAKYPTNIIKFEVADYKDITTTDIKVSAGDDIELSGDLPNFVAKAPKADDITVEVVNVEDFESYKFSIAEVLAIWKGRLYLKVLQMHGHSILATMSLATTTFLLKPSARKTDSLTAILSTLRLQDRKLHKVRLLKSVQIVAWLF